MKRLWIVASFIIGVTFCVYIPSLNNDFVNWDDLVYVTENNNIRTLNLNSISWMFTSFRASNWHPLTWFSHSLDISLFGLNPARHHLTSVILHTLNTLWVFLLSVLLIYKGKNNLHRSYKAQALNRNSIGRGDSSSFIRHPSPSR